MNTLSARIGFYVILAALFFLPGPLGTFVAIVAAWGLARVAVGMSLLPGVKRVGGVS